MSPILAGQLRHVLTALGGAAAGGSVATGSLETALGGLLLALAGHLWSYFEKKAR